MNDPGYQQRPSMCRNCGAIVAAGESTCPQCGTPLNSVPQPVFHPLTPQDRQAMRFARIIFRRPAPFSIIFLVANFFLFLLMWESSGLGWNAVWEFPQEVLLRYGAKLNLLVDQGHQWWRFVTPVFIHVGLFHLLVNMYALWMLGPLVERLYGSAKFVLFWVVTGVAGVAASYYTVQPKLHTGFIGSFLFKAQDVPSAGASGALFGLIGVLFVFGIKFRHELPENFKQAFGAGLLPTILINFFIGFAGRGFIDNAAHVGGLVSGAVLALLVRYRRPGERGGMDLLWYVLQAAALVLVGFSFFQVMRHFRDPLPNGVSNFAVNLPSGAAAFVANFQAMQRGQAAMQLAVNKADPGQIDSAIKELDSAPQLDDQTGGVRNKLKALLGRARDYAQLVKSRSGPSNALEQQKARIISDFESWQNEYLHWAETDGKQYGFTLKSADSKK